MARSQEPPHPRTRKSRDRIGGPSDNDRAGREILGDDDPEGQKTVVADRQALVDAALAAKEPAFANPSSPSNAALPRQEAVVADDAVMADVIAPPDDDV